MSLYKDASLVMLPSAYKDGKLYSIRPTDGSGDFTFSRGSNLAATRVDVNGLIEKGRENLLLRSNDFSNASWQKVNVTLTSGQSGYDGSSDAWLLERTNTGGRIQQSVSINGVNTFSVYAKSGTLNWIELLNSSSPFQSAFFDLQNGVIGNVDSDTINAAINSVGNGWYRCEISLLFSGATSFRISLADGNGDKSGTSGSIYIQDAQLEQGLVATDYIETGASTAQAGILEDMPRLDYSGGASCPSLLLEPQRTNTMLQSEYIKSGVGSWEINGDGTITAENNSTTSPEGKQNAAKITKDGSGYSYVRTSMGSNGGVFSFYAKKGNYRYIGIRNADNTSTHSVFDFDTESFVRVETGHTCDFEDVGNGWYRLWDYNASGENALRGIAMCDANGTEYNPTTPNGSYNYVWGFQAEYDVSYPTSYIPTYGSSVTRSADDMDTTFSSPLATNGSATIFFHELGLADSDDINTTGGGYRYQKDTSNYVSLATNATAWRVRVQSGGTSNFKGLNDHPKTSPIKVAIVVTSNTFSIYANGIKELDNESLSSTADFSSIDGFISIIADNIGVRKSVQHLVFPTALTDSECIALTTL